MNPNIDHLALLMKQKSNRFIKKYIKEISREAIGAKGSKKEYGYKDIIQMINKNQLPPLYWGRKAKKKDLFEIAHVFKKEKDPEKINKYLRMFSQVKYPLGVEDLLKWARHKKHKRLWFFYTALSNFKDSRVRELAINNLDKHNSIDMSLELLINNYEEGDHNLIYKNLVSIKDKHNFHGTAHTVTEIANRNRDRKLKKTLIHIYKHITCSFCREDIVKNLMLIDSLPKWIAKELPYDSSEDLRKMKI